jgi:alkaline phosphatase D
MPDGDGIGPEYQANPLQAWRIHRGRLECFEEGGDRSLLLLTRGLADRRATVKMSVRLGRLEPKSVSKDGWVGFRLGLREDHAEGLNAGITSDGRLFIGTPEEGTPLLNEPLDNLKLSMEWVQGWLSIEVNQIRVSKNLARSDTTGGIALVCGSGAGRFWFRDWTLSGSRVDDHKTGLTNSEQRPR